VWASGHISVGKLWEYYCQYVYLPRLAERPVLNNGILGVFSEMLWDHDGFAVASGYDEATGKYLGLAIPQENVAPQITDLTLLVHPDRAIAQRERADADAARAAAAAAAGSSAGTTEGGSASGGTSGPTTGTLSGASTPSGTSPVPDPPRGPKNTRFYGTARLDPERYVRDFNKLYQEVIQHLAAPEGVDLEITVEISASKRDGYPDDKARIVTENARTLKFDQYGFEDH
jgi:hypothetical protein